jgi:DNA-binding MarR family transcriptional regulator
MEPLSQRPDFFGQGSGRELSELVALVLEVSASGICGAASLNEILVTHHLAASDARGESVTVMSVSRDLKIPKATVSRILTDMRSRGLIVEDHEYGDGRSHFVRLSDAHYKNILTEVRAIIDWCRLPGRSTA